MHQRSSSDHIYALPITESVGVLCSQVGAGGQVGESLDTRTMEAHSFGKLCTPLTTNMSHEIDTGGTPIETRTIQKLRLRILPFLFLLYVVSFLDRINIGFAALTMNKELAITSQQLLPNIRRSNWYSLSISTSDTTTASIFL